MRSPPSAGGTTGDAWGLDMYRVLAQSRSRSTGTATSRRITQTTCGSTRQRASAHFSITDAKRNLAELFEPGEEVVTYATEDELVEKIQYYLGDEPERAGSRMQDSSGHSASTRTSIGCANSCDP